MSAFDNALVTAIKQELQEWDAEMNRRMGLLVRNESATYEAPPCGRSLYLNLRLYFENHVSGSLIPVTKTETETGVNATAEDDGA